MWLLGVVVRRYIDFLILLIPTPLVSVLFLQQHPYFLFILLNVFRSCKQCITSKKSADHTINTASPIQCFIQKFLQEGA